MCILFNEAQDPYTFIFIFFLISVFHVDFISR